MTGEVLQGYLNLSQFFHVLVDFKLVTAHRELRQRCLEIFELVRLVILAGLLPYFDGTCLINRDLHVLSECNVASKAYIEQLVLHLIEVRWSLCVGPRVIVEDFG